MVFHFIAEVAVVPQCFHLIISLTVDRGIFRREGISQTVLFQRRHPITVPRTMILGWWVFYTSIYNFFVLHLLVKDAQFAFFFINYNVKLFYFFSILILLADAQVITTHCLNMESMYSWWALFELLQQQLCSFQRYETFWQYFSFRPKYGANMNLT